MTPSQPINPFYARRQQRPQQHPVTRAEDRPRPQYARLPRAPKNGSPVPHLTSLYHFHRAGEYGDRSYPGNCSGNLIRDVLLYFRPQFAMDPMAGSGTCADVCQELNIPCMSYDIHQGFDACDPKDFSMVDMFDFIWAHPAYWRMKLYLDSPKDLSRSPTLEHFLTRYGQFIRNAARALKPGGKLAILMGDYSDPEAGFLPLTYDTKRLAFEAGLRQHCTDIIRFSHGASSSQKVYQSSFIPGLHDTLAIFEKPSLPRRGQ
jgi:SAM-dependent methyltransferase